ncbi:MAG: hydroxyisourate hydrolase [Proteobacteria bacterium]|nr:hydroxyisourate hydrolase [Pseudomonadota bacterium]MCP4919800.1 hydroxyisourate hydrolase [Pseudomonadota bacterium]
MSISTHVLDQARGGPAVGVPVLLERLDGEWTSVVEGRTNEDGRLPALSDVTTAVGVYRITFDTDAWFEAEGLEGFYPYASIVFRVVDDSHHHVPLLLAPYGYSTYRGS